MTPKKGKEFFLWTSNTRTGNSFNDQQKREHKFGAKKVGEFSSSMLKLGNWTETFSV
jgi:hypothetical protein